ncbi:hypothetical protein P7H38_07410 [Lactococcus raffinolactis]|uniref:hypothetical protein n=1 Tax=Pseudolactococcus raffinolactis TaxID=1366 RepID=UPI00288E64D5|nr:hypothetical protein [Lactococcus raffinolactis]MDT2766510.1 hypothetical protein [Lactococcus raffinolactis]MDT2789670.1 hypothetical protein [Lactococcus raffinolactis]
MKKLKTLGLLLLGIFIFSACSSSNNSSEISKLKSENQKLRKRNEKLNSQISEYENGNSTKKEAETNTSSNGTSEKGTESEKIKNNEPISFSLDGKEAIKLKVTSVSSNQSSFPSYMVSLDDYDVSKMISVTIEYTNIAYTEAYIPHTQYFQAYTKTGASLERIDQQDGQDAVTTGRTGTTTIFFKSTDDTSTINEIELDFMSKNETGKLCTFDLSVSH